LQLNGLDLLPENLTVWLSISSSDSNPYDHYRTIFDEMHAAQSLN